MFYKKLHILIALFAALAVSITSLAADDSVWAFSVKLVVAVTVFYLFGCIIKAYLDKKVFPEDKSRDNTPAPGKNENGETSADDEE